MRRRGRAERKGEGGYEKDSRGKTGLRVQCIDGYSLKKTAFPKKAGHKIRRKGGTEEKEQEEREQNTTM